MSYNLPTRKLVSQADSAMIQRPDVPRSKFTGSWTAKKTFDAGLLIPFMLDEVLPGDMLKYDVTAYVRMATPLFPMFDSQRVDTFFFYVPNRIIWDNFVRMMGEQASPGASINFTVPTITSPAGGFAQESIYDHFGIPVNGQITAGQTIEVNALPLRAYALIFNEWFRDQNMVPSVTIATGDGPDGFANYGVYRRAKSQDYFTSCLPWPQKFAVPSIPLTGSAPVRGIGTTSNAFATTNTSVFETGNFGVNRTLQFTQQPSAATWFIEGTSAVSGRPAIFADLSAAGATFTINALRDAFLIQTLTERDARGGTRYTELVKAHFGVTSPDARLQRPEYIGGGSTPLNLTPVAQTAPTAGVPVGALGAAGTSVGQHSASYAATEHGFIIGIINVRSELSYQQGLHRMWTRRSRYDYYWPSLAGLGEQAVLRQEIFCTGTDADDTTIFGYQERHHEYRTRYSEITGRFRSTSTGPLDGWHLSQRFASAPVLGQTFIQDDPPMARVLAAGALAIGQQYLADIMIRREATRPIPMYGTPTTLGRF